MRRLAPLCLLATIALAPFAAPAAAQDLPHFPKAAPPQPLPDPSCDATKADTGAWLIGNWVGPRTRLQFTRTAQGIHWILNRQGGADEFGWQDGATIDGMVTTVSACTVQLKAGGGPFVFDGVRTEEGHIYGYATNQAGAAVRLLLRRER